MEKRSCLELAIFYCIRKVGRKDFRWLGCVIGLLVSSVIGLSCKQTEKKEVESVRLHHSLVVGDDTLLLGEVFDLAWENDSVLVIVDSGNEGFLHTVHIPDGR